MTQTAAAEGPKPPNPFALMAAASRGDLEAQRALAQQAAQSVFSQCTWVAEARKAGIEATLSVWDEITLVEGLVFARLAAAHGDRSDKTLLFGLLGITNMFLSPADAAVPQAELLARIALLAEQGVTDADQLVDVEVARSSPEVVALSQEYRKLIEESETA